MKREKIIILLERIKKHKLEPQSIKFILKQDEQILDKLVNLKEELFIKGINLINIYTGDTILEALDILSNSKYSYTYEVLINDNLIKRGLSLGFGRIINSLGAVYSSEYLKCILCNRTDIPTDMLFICTEIIKNTKHYFNAKYVSEVLCSGIILNDEILLLLKEIATTDKIYCARYISDILIYSTLDLDTISLGIYEIINNSGEEYTSRCISRLLCHSDNIDKEIIKEGIKLINNTTSNYMAESLCEVLINSYNIPNDLILSKVRVLIEQKNNYLVRIMKDDIIKSFDIERYSNDNGINTLINIVNEQSNSNINVKTLSKKLIKE